MLRQPYLDHLLLCVCKLDQNVHKKGHIFLELLYQEALKDFKRSVVCAS